MIFIDTNIFMYAAGGDHQNKIPSLKLLHDAAARKIDGCTNVEVLQEILHRYRSIKRWDDGKEVYTLASAIIPKIYAIDKAVLDRCYEIMNKYTDMSARDCLHIAFCRESGIDTICSFDKDFDGIDELNRAEPQTI